MSTPVTKSNGFSPVSFKDQSSDHMKHSAQAVSSTASFYSPVFGKNLNYQASPTNPKSNDIKIVPLELPPPSGASLSIQMRALSLIGKNN